MTKLDEHFVVKKSSLLYLKPNQAQKLLAYFMIFTLEVMILLKTIMAFLIVLILSSAPILNYNGDFVAFQIAFAAICWLLLCHHKIDPSQQIFF